MRIPVCVCVWTRVCERTCGRNITLHISIMSLHRTSELIGVGLIRNASLLHLHRGILSLAFNISLDIQHFEHSNMIEICDLRQAVIRKPLILIIDYGKRWSMINVLLQLRITDRMDHIWWRWLQAFLLLWFTLYMYISPVHHTERLVKKTWCNMW